MYNFSVVKKERIEDLCSKVLQDTHTQPSVLIYVTSPNNQDR